MGLPDNATLRAFAREVTWQSIEEMREQFQKYLDSVRAKRGSHPESTNMLWHLVQPYLAEDTESPDGNVLLSKGNTPPIVLANILGKRFQQSAWIDYVKPYNLNPAVIHDNIHE